MAVITKIIMYDRGAIHVKYSTGTVRAVRKLTNTMRSFIENAGYQAHAGDVFGAYTIYREKELMVLHSFDERHQMIHNVRNAVSSMDSWEKGQANILLNYWEYAELEKEAELILTAIVNSSCDEERYNLLHSDETNEFTAYAYEYRKAYR